MLPVRSSRPSSQVVEWTLTAMCDMLEFYCTNLVMLLSSDVARMVRAIGKVGAHFGTIRVGCLRSGSALGDVSLDGLRSFPGRFSQGEAMRTLHPVLMRESHPEKRVVPRVQEVL